MGSASKYWQLVKLDSTGKRRVEMIITAKTYFQSQFPDWAAQPEVSDAAVQRELWQRIQNTLDTPEIAELCLRCYISHQIDHACRDLGTKFGSRNGFTHEDLLPFVLDDDGRIRPTTSYRSIAATILQTFDPSKGALSTWVSRQVKQHPELKRFLLQHGVYLVSDWAILNDTAPKQLQRLLTDLYQLTPIETQQASELLQSFHTVYREDRLQQRRSGGKQLCQPPTPEQLQRIAEELQRRIQRTVSPEVILNQLSAIAAKLRRYRISAQGGSVAEVSFDQPEMQPLVQVQPLEENQEHVDFLEFYRTQFLECLDHAIADVIPSIVAGLQRKRKPSDQAFLTALHLFHCEGRSMSDIAPQVGLKKQFEVTRLLKLNELRADIRQRSLLTLRDRVVDQAKLYADVDRLQRLDQHVETILDEQLETVIQEAVTESKAPVRNQPLRSLLARRLCHYLAARKSHP